MLDNIKSRLERIPRWLLVVWAIAGPFLGMLLRELLKDRFFGGVNEWIDQNYGSAMSTLAASALWLVWMAIFGASLLAVWWLTRRYDVVLAPAATPSPALEPRAPPAKAYDPVPLPAYEVEKKLRLIDSALKVVREDMPPAFKMARELESGGWGAFKSLERRQPYIDDLTACRDAVAGSAAALEKLRQGHPEYRDISIALQQPPDGSPLQSTLGNFIRTFANLSASLKDGTSSDVLENLMGPRRLELQLGLEKFEAWRVQTEGALRDLRRILSP